MKIILLNSPPSTGKDLFAKTALDMLGNCAEHLKFATPLIDHVKLLHDISDEVWESWYKEGLKEVKRAELDGHSCREALVITAKRLKKRNGDNYFAIECAMDAYNMAKNGTELVVISDLGFEEEINTFVDFFDPQDIYIVTISREGCEFGFDDRRYVEHILIPEGNYISILNDGTSDFLFNVKDTVKYVMEDRVTLKCIGWVY